METILSLDVAQLRSFIDNYDCLPAMQEMQGWYVPPAAAVCAYLATVFLLPLVVGRSSPFLKAVCRPLFALWNLMLGIFSCWGCVVCATFVWREMTWKLEGGASGADAVRHLICSDEMIFRPDSGACFAAVGLAATLFTYSKFVELGDTLFIILLGKKVEFLQWYHHATVLVYCWLAYGERTPSALTFGTMNYFVHSIMYLYFAVSQYSTILRPLRMFITSIQLLQMAVGLAVVSLSYYYTFVSPQGCSASYSTWYFWCCGVMYFSYFVLFARLLADRYFPSQSRGKKTKGE